MPRGVTVALQILDLCVMVRIHARQPISFHPELRDKQRLEFAHGGFQFVVERGPVGSRQGVCATLGEAAVRIGFGNLFDDRVDAGDKLAGFGNCCQRQGFGGLTGREEVNLTAAEIPAANRTLPVDRATALPVCGAGLKEKLLPLFFPQLETQRGEPARGVARLKDDRVKQNPVAAHAARGAKTLGGGCRVGDHMRRV